MLNINLIVWAASWHWERFQIGSAFLYTLYNNFDTSVTMQSLVNEKYQITESKAQI